MPKLSRLITFLSVFVLFSFSFLFASQKTVLADRALSYDEWNSAVENGTFTLEDSGKSFADNQLNWIFHVTAASEDSAIGMAGSMVAYMVSSPPVSSNEYLADLGSSIGLPVKSAYAQGTGWKALSPVLPIWKAFRNIAYMAFVIIFIAIGFMVMFRAKINPQTVITVQSALPKLIITLLMITFSYAIAGLMIDLIYVCIYLVVGIFSLGGLITNAGEVSQLLLSKNPFSFVYMGGTEDLFTSGPADAIQFIIEGIFGDWGIDNILTLPLGGLAKAILAVSILFSVIRLFFSLLLSYLGIVLSVIFAPLTILFQALPGSTSFVNWLKGLLANVAPFPVVAAMFLIAAVLIGPKGDTNPWNVQEGVGFYSQDGSGEVWVPPMLIGSNQKGFGSVNAFQGLIAFGIIMITPTIVGRIKKMLKTEPSGFGGAIAGGLLAGPAALGSVAKQTYQGITMVTSQKSAKEQKEYFKAMRAGIGGGRPSE